MSTVHALRDRGHDVVHARDENLHRAEDAQILEKAAREGRIVLTFDLDFGDLLAAALRTIPSVMIFRLHNQIPSSVSPRVLQVTSEAEADLSAGAVIIVEDARYRIRRLPIRPEG